MSEIKVLKCPNCGAPLNNDGSNKEIVCPYCGSACRISVPDDNSSASKEAQVILVKRKRNAFDKILIFFGGIWVIITAVVMTDLHYWTDFVGFIAGLLFASPGITLLLIGFRRKKPKLIRRDDHNPKA